MNNKLSLLALVIALAALACVFVREPDKTNVATKETAYQRVMRTRTLHCGYNIWPPSIMQDENGKLAGAYVEFIEELARNANLKLEWTAKLDWGTFPEDLATGKVDAMCAGVWADAKRGTITAWTAPVWYNLIEADVRADDPRFPTGQDNLNRLNSEDITIAVLEGAATAVLAEKYFPKARKYTVPALADVSDTMLAVAGKKADVVFVDSGAVRFFQKNNPGKLRRYAPRETVATYPQTIGVNIHETALQNLLNAATNEIVNLGVAERIARKYDPEAVNFVPPAVPFKAVTTAQ